MSIFSVEEGALSESMLLLVEMHLMSTEEPIQWLIWLGIRFVTGNLWFDPHPIHTKDFKNGISCSFVWRSALRK